MSPDNRREAAQAELRRAEEALREAEALLGLGMANGSVSRAYYVVYHGASALLARIGEQPRTHRGIQRLLSSRLVDRGLLAREQLARFGRLQQRRTIADYRAAEALTCEEASALVADARAFLETARSVIDTLT